MTRRPECVDFDAAHDDLRVLLSRWDPISGAPDDEYDCLIPGLSKRLRAGEREDQLLQFLDQELVEHFGLQPRPEADREFIRQLVAWWTTRNKGSDA